MDGEFHYNNWGYIRSMTVSDYGQLGSIIVPGDNTFIKKPTREVELDVRVPASPEVMEFLYHIAKNKRGLPMWRPEWMCLYCASPNKLPDTHCSQCGGPRNWILG